jgi:hypothetical protein
MAYLINHLRSSKPSFKRLESEKLSEKPVRDLLDIDSYSEKDNGAGRLALILAGAVSYSTVTF